MVLVRTLKAIAFLWVIIVCHAKTQTRHHNHKPSSLGNPTFGKSSKRRACRLYMWDVPSALLYRWCRHLENDCVYEGRGGRHFVRVRPGSMLQLLHPCSQHSPDRCFLCGGDYRDHLILGWVKHLYKPFDLMLDMEYQDSLVFPVTSKSHLKNSFHHGSVTAPRHAFHRRYVLDISHKIIDKTGKRLRYQERRKILNQEFQKKFGNSRGLPVAVISSKDAWYLPDQSPEGKHPSLLVALCRLLLVDSVSALYRLQLRDNTSLVTERKPEQ